MDRCFFCCRVADRFSAIATDVSSILHERVESVKPNYSLLDNLTTRHLCFKNSNGT